MALKNQKNKNSGSSFKDAVAATPDIAQCYQPGLQGLGNHSAKIEMADPSKCGGSVDIDKCTTYKYPQSNRWDYCFSYDSQVYFVEVHTANTSEVATVLNKLKWLKDWLLNNAPEINKLKNKERPFYWIQSNRCDILKGSSQYRKLIEAGIKPIPKLVLK